MRALYTFFRSSTSYRVRIALSVKGLEWEPRFVSLPKMEHRDSAYLDVNPQGLVPALVEEDGHVLAQSLAILEYLEEAYPEPPLLPKDLYERAYVRRLSQIIGCDIHPLNNVRVLKWLAANVPDDKGLADRWYAHWIAEGFRGFEACLVREARHGDLLPRRPAHHGRHLPRAAGRQCPPLQLRPLRVPGDGRDRRPRRGASRGAERRA